MLVPFFYGPDTWIIMSIVQLHDDETVLMITCPKCDSEGWRLIYPGMDKPIGITSNWNGIIELHCINEECDVVKQFFIDANWIKYE